jgi:hypothetical protein
MEPGTVFHKNIRVEFKKDVGVVFDKCAEIKTLVVKMEETGEAFKLMSKDGKSLIMEAKDFPESEAVFNDFFEATTKTHKRTSNAFVGMRMACRAKMVKIKGVRECSCGCTRSRFSFVL